MESFCDRTMNLRLLIIGVMMAVSGCVSELEQVLIPEVDRSMIVGTERIVDTTKRDILDGVYTTDESQTTVKRFGTVLSVRLNANGTLSIYAAQGIHTMLLEGGLRNDSAIYVGSWRSINSPATGSITVVIRPDEGGADVSRGKATSNLVLRCRVRTGNGSDQALVLRWQAKLTDDLRNFHIIAHRGGGRNSERLGVSENSLPMLRLAPYLGATGVEIDVEVTKDGIPIVFHDPSFTPRTVQGSYIMGSVASYTYQQIRQHVRLVNGEPIPTLQEALQTIIEETPLELVWLDVKQPSVTAAVLEACLAAQTTAQLRNRTVEILLGIPTAAILQAYRNANVAGKDRVGVLCELDPQTARSINARVWAPRFTDGIQRSEAEQMRQEGRRVFVWTLDDRAFMSNYLQERYRNGLLYTGVLTNYPTLLAAILYASKVTP